MFYQLSSLNPAVGYLPAFNVSVVPLPKLWPSCPIPAPHRGYRQERKEKEKGTSMIKKKGTKKKDKKQKRGQIYLLVLLGLPCPLNSTRFSILCSISSTNRELPVNWPRWSDWRISSHSPSGIVPFTHSTYLSARFF